MKKEKEIEKEVNRLNVEIIALMIVVKELKMSMHYSACNAYLQKNKEKIIRPDYKEMIKVYHTCKRKRKEICD